MDLVFGNLLQSTVQESIIDFKSHIFYATANPKPHKKICGQISCNGVTTIINKYRGTVLFLFYSTLCQHNIPNTRYIPGSLQRYSK
jgi:hypothetical protein